jgi:hypothetical protein
MQTPSPLQRAVRFSELSPSCQKLVRLCQTINYGSLRGLQIREREPVFDPEPTLLADVKLDGDCVARPELDLDDFVLREEVLRLMDHLDGLVNTTIECLEVHAGIPRRLTVRSPFLQSLRQGGPAHSPGLATSGAQGRRH